MRGATPEIVDLTVCGQRIVETLVDRPAQTTVVRAFDAVSVDQGRMWQAKNLQIFKLRMHRRPFVFGSEMSSLFAALDFL